MVDGRYLHRILLAETMVRFCPDFVMTATATEAATMDAGLCVSAFDGHDRFDVMLCGGDNGDGRRLPLG